MKQQQNQFWEEMTRKYQCRNAQLRRRERELQAELNPPKPSPGGPCSLFMSLMSSAKSMLPNNNKSPCSQPDQSSIISDTCSCCNPCGGDEATPPRPPMRRSVPGYQACNCSPNIPPPPPPSPDQDCTCSNDQEQEFLYDCTCLDDINPRQPEEDLRDCCCNPCGGEVTTIPPNMKKISMFSLKSADMEYMRQLMDLVQAEKEMKCRINQLQYKNAGNACDLLKQNSLLKNELEDTKLELKQQLETVKGPMKHQLEKERFKCQQLEDQLRQVCKEVTDSQDFHIKELNSLKMQLCCACSNMNELSSLNEKMKGDMKCLECKYNQLQDDLVRQKLSEAQTIQRLTHEIEKLKNGGEDECECCDQNLLDIARKLSKALKDSEVCGDCSQVPSDIACAAKCIKDLAVIVGNVVGEGAGASNMAQECACTSGYSGRRQRGSPTRDNSGDNGDDTLVNDDTLGDDTLLNDTLRDDSPGDDSPGDDSPGDDTVIEATLVENTLVESTLVEDTLVEQTMVGEDSSSPKVSIQLSPGRTSTPKRGGRGTSSKSCQCKKGNSTLGDSTLVEDTLVEQTLCGSGSPRISNELCPCRTSTPKRRRRNTSRNRSCPCTAGDSTLVDDTLVEQTLCDSSIPNISYQLSPGRTSTPKRGGRNTSRNRSCCCSTNDSTLVDDTLVEQTLCNSSIPNVSNRLSPGRTSTPKRGERNTSRNRSCACTTGDSTLDESTLVENTLVQSTLVDSTLVEDTLVEQTMVGEDSSGPKVSNILSPCRTSTPKRGGGRTPPSKSCPCRRGDSTLDDSTLVDSTLVDSTLVEDTLVEQTMVGEDSSSPRVSIQLSPGRTSTPKRGEGRTPPSSSCPCTQFDRTLVDSTLVEDTLVEQTMVGEDSSGPNFSDELCSCKTSTPKRGLESSKDKKLEKLNEISVILCQNKPTVAPIDCPEVKTPCSMTDIYPKKKKKEDSCCCRPKSTTQKILDWICSKRTSPTRPCPEPTQKKCTEPKMPKDAFANCSCAGKKTVTVSDGEKTDDEGTDGDDTMEITTVTSAHGTDATSSTVIKSGTNMEKYLPLNVDTQIEVLDKKPDGVHITTSVTKSGTIQVVTEGPEGVIETHLTYTDTGDIQVLTEIVEENRTVTGDKTEVKSMKPSNKDLPGAAGGSS